jgi:hypothetical protein
VLTFDELHDVAKEWGAYAVPFDGKVKGERRFYLNGMMLIYRRGILYASDGKTPIDRWFTTVVGMMSDLYKLENAIEEPPTLEEVLATVS